MLIEEKWNFTLIPTLIVVYYLGLRKGIWAGVVLALIGMLLEVISLFSPGGTIITFLGGFAEIIRIPIMAFVVGFLIESLKMKQVKAEEVNKNLAIIDERGRISRELHDSLAQNLSLCSVKLETAITYSENRHTDQSLRKLVELKGLLMECHRDVRCSISDLKCDVNEDKSINSIIANCLSGISNNYGLVIDVKIDTMGELFLPLETSLHLVRIIQEAFSNIRKHAGVQQAYFFMKLDTQSKMLIQIEDRGCGFNYTTQTNLKSFGLRSMIERAGLLGVDLVIDARPGVGTRVEIGLELPRGEGDVDEQKKGAAGG
ncbi:MAG: sensor histidine kinase [Bacillota bacterium]